LLFRVIAIGIACDWRRFWINRGPSRAAQLRSFGATRGSAKDFAAFLHAWFEAEGDVADLSIYSDRFEISQHTWRLMTNVADYHPAYTRALNGLIEGLAAGSGLGIAVGLKPSAGGGPPFVWSID
jgi:hypothetical protein